MSRRLLVLTVGLLTLAGGRAAWAVCNVPNVCTFSYRDHPECCGLTSCTIDGTVTVVPSPPGSVCNFDFGALNLTITGSGHFRVGSNTATLTAGSVTVKGELSAKGGTSPNPGGNITITTTGGTATAFSTPTGGSAAVIDLSGFGTKGGGTLAIHADGAVLLDVGTLNLNGLEPASSGGTLIIDSSAGAMRINVPVTANGGSGGFGGTVSIAAPEDLTVTKQMFVNAGFGGGGGIDLDARGALLLGVGSILQANGLADSGSDGGLIDIIAGVVTATGEIDADGGSDPDGVGGFGNSVSFESRTGPLNLASGDVTADGAPGGDGGSISLTTDSLNPSGDVTVNARLSAIGPPSLSDGVPTSAGGGSLEVNAAGTVLLQKTIDVSGSGGGNASISFTAARDVNLTADIRGSDRSAGADLEIDAGHDVIFGANVTVKGLITDGGDGGSITASAGNDVKVVGFQALDVSGTVAGFGGTIDLEAVGNLTVNTGASLTASGGSLAGSEGGDVTLLAGEPDTAGDLTLNGRVITNGTSTGLGGASVFLRGCQVLISGTGVVDSRGDAASTNTVVARTTLTIQSQAKVQATNGNVAIFREGAPPTVGGTATISPSFSPGPCADGTPTAIGSFGTGCAKPACTDRNTPAGCLIPCPQCGNGRVEGPWETCDPGNTANRCGANPPCSLHCRILNCTDGNPCTTDDCDNLGGCFNSPGPDGTPCDDGTVCDGRETCVFGVCSLGRPLDCNDGNPCTMDCDPVQGCVNRPLSGTGIPGCDDGNPCDGTETCVNGDCRPGTPPCPQGEFCDPHNGACTSSRPCPGGNADCDDGNPCNGTETCAGGFCRAGTPLGNGAPCPDGTVCNGSETCQGGVCVRGPAPDCDDGEICTVDTCDAALGCQHTPIPNCCHTAVECDDHNMCTTDTCTDNQCSNAVDPACCQVDADCDDHNPCTQDSPCTANRCTHTPLSGPQAGCGDACSPTATCEGGSCNLGAPLVCPDDGDICTNDLCDPVTGCTIHQRIPDCCHSVADCDDGNVCTDDACSLTDMRCTHTLRSVTCIPCSTDTDCDPAGRCAGEACGADGTCTTVTPFSCSDNDPNTRDVCVLGPTGQPQCQHPCIANGACDDRDACNGPETCNTATGACVAGTPPPCDICAPCEPATGCVAKRGLDGAKCHVGVIDTALSSASPTDLKPAVQKRLGRKVQKIVTKIDVAAAADQVGNVKRERKLRNAADTLLGGLEKAASKALTKHQMSPALAALVQDRAARAMQSLP